MAKAMSDQQWIWRCDRKIPSDTGIGRQVMEEVLDQLQSHHWFEHDIYSVRLAMEEALVNAIAHGNKNCRDKHVQICCDIGPEVIRIQITDEGKGFKPGDVPDPRDPDGLIRPGGRGVMLMKAFMSRVEFNDAGNSVVMEKVLARG
jgi:serine/threonine-protein kinase RsbW